MTRQLLTLCTCHSGDWVEMWLSFLNLMSNVGELGVVTKAIPCGHLALVPSPLRPVHSIVGCHNSREMNLRLTLLVLLISCSTNSQSSVDIKDLIGIWQDSPQVAAGWSETFQFFEDGSYVYRYSQMDCTKRLLSYAGTWKLVGEDELRMTMTSRTILEGGSEVPSSGSCDFEIQGGHVKKIMLEDLQSVDLILSTTVIDTDNGNLRTRFFGDRQFWKHEDDPNKY